VGKGSDSMTGRKTNWVLIIAGVLLVGVSSICLFYPALTLLTISLVVGIFLLFSSVSDLIVYFRRASTSVPLLAYTILDFLLGLVFLVYPLAMVTTVPWIIGFFLLLFGVFELIACLKIMRKAGTSLWGLMMLSGIVSCICGICFLVMPESFALFIGAFVLMRGISLLIQGISIGRMKIA
jgi:uncharacterized membrane protein HdeD (DUF308 family)